MHRTDRVHVDMCEREFNKGRREETKPSKEEEGEGYQVSSAQLISPANEKPQETPQFDGQLSVACVLPLVLFGDSHSLLFSCAHQVLFVAFLTSNTRDRDEAKYHNSAPSINFFFM
jgi:hypothetical protein